MVHVHGRDVAQRAARIAHVAAEQRLLVPVDVGKHEAMALVADAAGERLVAPFTFTLDRPGLAEFVQRVDRVAAVRGKVEVEVGVEAAGHYHRPVTASSMLPSSWTLIELNPAHVTEQRRVAGKRGIKTDQSIWLRCSICSWSDAGSWSAAGRSHWRSCRPGWGCVTGASPR
jgi:hypothetical protein